MSELTDAMQKAMEGRLPGLFGIQLLSAGHGQVTAELEVREELLAPNEFLHAGTVVTLADSCCGMGCIASLPEGAAGFTTVELKVNFLGTARDGTVVADARLVHAGRTTQLWDADVRQGERRLAAFRCTQLLLRG